LLPTSMRIASPRCTLWRKSSSRSKDDRDTIE
jgi:hypothetical protein